MSPARLGGMKYLGRETTMKKATKGAYLSGLVYPGTGQLFFGRLLSGLAFISLTTIALGVLIYRIAKRIYRVFDPVLEKLVNKSLTFQEFKELLNQSGYSGWDLELTSLIVVVFCWTVSIIHAYYLGKRKSGIIENRISGIEIRASSDQK